jgi:hypothetical protein
VINHALVMADRERVGRDASPSAAIIDSQSVKTTEAGADPVAIDAGRLFAGRRRRCSGGACACGECGRSLAGQKRTPRHDRHWFPAVIGRIGAGDSQSDIARSYGVAHIAIGRLTHAPHSEDHAAAAASPHTKSR